MQESMEKTTAMIEHFAEVDRILQKHNFSAAKLIPILQEIQDVYNCLSKEVISYQIIMRTTQPFGVFFALLISSWAAPVVTQTLGLCLYLLNMVHGELKESSTVRQKQLNRL